MKKVILILAILFTPTISRSILAVQPNLQDDKKTCEILTKEDRIFGLVKIYSTVKQHFAYFERLPNLDWDKTFKEYLPLVEKEQSLLEYYRTLQTFHCIT